MKPIVLAAILFASPAFAWQQDQHQAQHQQQTQQAFGGAGGGGGGGGGGGSGGSIGDALAIGLAAGGTNAPNTLQPCTQLVIDEGQRAYAHGFGLTAKGVGSYGVKWDRDCLREARDDEFSHAQRMRDAEYEHARRMRDLNATAPAGTDPGSSVAVPVPLPVAVAPSRFDNDTRQRAAAYVAPKRRKAAAPCARTVPVTTMVCAELGATAKVVSK